MVDVIRVGSEHPVEAGSSFETGPRGDLTDAAYIDEVDEQEGRYRVKYDPSQATPRLAILTAVSNITGRGLFELEPLYGSIDPEALDALFAAGDSSVCRLTFQYSGYEVTVESDAEIELVSE